MMQTPGKVAKVEARKPHPSWSGGRVGARRPRPAAQEGRRLLAGSGSKEAKAMNVSSKQRVSVAIAALALAGSSVLAACGAPSGGPQAAPTPVAAAQPKPVSVE